jgi:hypothetical protein
LTLLEDHHCIEHCSVAKTAALSGAEESSEIYPSSADKSNSTTTSAPKILAPSPFPLGL